MPARIRVEASPNLVSVVVCELVDDVVHEVVLGGAESAYVPDNGIVAVEVADGGVAIGSTPGPVGGIATHIKLDDRPKQQKRVP